MYIYIEIHANKDEALVNYNGKEIWTNKSGANSFIALAKMKNMKEVSYNRFDNGDERRWFN